MSDKDQGFWVVTALADHAAPAVLDLARGQPGRGMVFRFGLRALTATDFARITAAMDSGPRLGQTVAA